MKALTGLRCRQPRRDHRRQSGRGPLSLSRGEFGRRAGSRGDPRHGGGGHRRHQHLMTRPGRAVGSRGGPYGSGGAPRFPCCHGSPWPDRCGGGICADVRATGAARLSDCALPGYTDARFDRLVLTPNWAVWDSPTRRSGRASSTPMHGLSVRCERPQGTCACPRPIGDELVPGVERFPLVDDVVAVEDGAALVAGQEHGDPLGHAGADQVAGGGAGNRGGPPQRRAGPVGAGG